MLTAGSRWDLERGDRGSAPQLSTDVVNGAVEIGSAEDLFPRGHPGPDLRLRVVL